MSSTPTRLGDGTVGTDGAFRGAASAQARFAIGAAALLLAAGAALVVARRARRTA